MEFPEFLKRTKNKISNDEVKVLQQKSIIGDRLQAFKAEGSLDILNEHILFPLELGAIEAFKITPANETLQIIETQVMQKMICEIRKQIDIKIEEGKIAREYLTHQNNSTQEDE